MEKYFLQNENICTRVRSILDFVKLNPRRTSLHRYILRINKGRILHRYNILPTNNRRIKSPTTAPFHFRFQNTLLRPCKTLFQFQISLSLVRRRLGRQPATAVFQKRFWVLQHNNVRFQNRFAAHAKQIWSICIAIPIIEWVYWVIIACF